MLYYLDDSLIVSSDDVRYLDIVRVVRNLAISVEESKHYLLASYKTLNHFREVFPSDPFITPLFNKLIENFAFYSIPPFLDRYVVITTGGTEIVEKEEKLVICINYSELLDTNSFRSTSLICEDLNDCSFYHHILNWYIENYRMRVNVSLSDTHGGGARIDSTALKEVDDHHFGVVIVDGDFKYPNDSEGDTAKKCRETFHGVTYLILIVLPSHEIENLIPSSFYSSNPDFQLPARRQKLNQLLSFDRAFEDIFQYLDFKSGWKMAEVMNDLEFRNFVEYCLSHSSLLNGVDASDYIENKRTRGDNMILEGLGKGTVGLILKHFISMPRDVDLFDFQNEIWKTLALQLISVGFSRGQEKLY